VPVLPSAEEYFPLNTGDRWSYGTDTQHTTLVSAIGPQQLPSGQAMLVRTMGQNGQTEEFYQRDANGVRQYPGPIADQLTTAFGPLLVMKPTLTVGDRWVVVDATVSNGVYIDDDSVPDVVALHMESTVIGMESLTVGGKDFTRVAHIQTVGTRSKKLSRSGNTLVTTVTSDDWYAPGLGLVRSRVTTVDGSLPPSTRESSLTGWLVGSQRSDTKAPGIVATSPAAGMIVSGCCVSVGARFDRLMDTSPPGEPLQLTGPDGKPVAGNTVWDWHGDFFAFTPSKRLTSGTYTARVTTANRDVAGNALPAELSWQFVVDTTGPVITPVQPLPNAKDVALDSKIVFTVEADTDFSRLALADLEVTSLAGSIEVDRSVSGNTITLTPKKPLPRGAHLRVQLGNLVDQLGNAGSLAWEFDTDPGRFAPPQALTTATVTAVAIGDLDGDGRNDVVLALPADGSGVSPTLQVFMGQAGGTFSAPRTYATAPGHERNITSLAVVDLDRKGQMAIVAGNDLTALQILRRQPDGRHAVSQVIDTASAYAVRVVDFNGDGRPDLVGRPYNGSEVQIWLQQPDGRFGAGRAVALESFGGSPGFAVGDLNSDGRLDIVTSGVGLGKQFGVAYQQPDGSFSSPVYVNVASGFWGQGVAIGDVNGDGRQDLIVSNQGVDAVSVLLQDAKGQLLPGVAQPGTDGATRVSLADIDGDGRLDIVSAGTGWPLIVTLQRSDGSLDTSQSFPRPWDQFFVDDIVAVGDLDGDGRPDILYGGYWLRQRAVPAPAGSGSGGTRPTWLGLGRLLRTR
jgi:hypothetical protein